MSTEICESRYESLLYDAGSTKKIPLWKYKEIKVKLLKQLGKRVDVSVFSDAKTEVQVDQITHRIIMA